LKEEVYIFHDNWVMQLIEIEMVFPTMKAGNFIPRPYSRRLSVNVPEKIPPEKENGILISLVTPSIDRSPIAL